MIIASHDRRHLVIVLVNRATTLRQHSFFCSSAGIQGLELLLVSAANLRLEGAARPNSSAKAHHRVAHLDASIEVLPLLVAPLFAM